MLRAVAILLVIGQHYSGAVWQRRFGWTGVDLFFVLSGFLVSGLLFDELAQSGQVDSVRFLIRRGFKIYPAFWAMIGVTVLVRLMEHTFQLRPVICELLFIQNYGPGLWAPTWSLAVEEHFYFALALGFAWMVRRWGRDSVRSWPTATMILMITVFVARCAGVLLLPVRYKLVIWGTHARIDALMFGTLLAYWHRTRSKQIHEVVQRRAGIITCAALALIAPAWVLGMDSTLVRTIGLVSLYLGYGAFLIMMLYTTPLPAVISRPLAYIGRYSYGIYIWHMPFQTIVVNRLIARGWLPATVQTNLLLYFAGCVIPGIMLSQLIENPFLRLRDRFFPARTQRSAIAQASLAA